MQRMSRLLLLFCMPGLLSLFSSRAMASPDTEKDASSWRARTIAAYQQGKDDLSALPSASQENKASDTEQLLALYQKESAGRLPAIACAYWGAMRLADPAPWIERMLQAGCSPGRRERKMGEEAVESLPEALQRIYQVRKAPAALEALINLQLDGCPAETLDDVRQSLFLKYPDAVAHLLARKPIQFYRDELRQSSGPTFTSELAFSLAYDHSLLQRFTRLRDQARKGHSPTDTFLTQYLTVVLNDAQKRQKRPTRIAPEARNTIRTGRTAMIQSPRSGSGGRGGSRIR